MVSLSNEQIVQLAVKHRFLRQDSAERLISEAVKLNLPAEALALKAGILSHWQIQALKTLSTPDDVAPGYRVSELIGRGGFGSVYRATQINMSRDVALKTIPLTSVDSSATRRFEREAKIIGGLRHPHIVAAFDFGYHHDRLFLSLELVEGQDLSKVLNRIGKFDELTTWHIMRQTVSALAYAAEQDVTHRDIKPGNLLATQAPIGFSLPANVPFIKVSDFGLACFSETRHEDGITLENSGLGTPSYVAPEQLMGSDADVRADIYSLGATAYHLLTGAAPYAGLSAMEVAKKKLKENETWPLGLEIGFSKTTFQLVTRMSQTSPSDRFSSHQELLSEIDSAIENLTNLFDHQTKKIDLATISPSVDLDSCEVTASKIHDAIQDTMTSGNFDSDFEIAEGTSAKTGGDDARIENHRDYRIRSWGITGVLLLLGLGLIFLFNPTNSSSSHPLERELQPDYATTVRSFNGLELDPSRYKLKGGAWAVEEDSEGGKVLAGENCKVKFPCLNISRLPFDFFRFSIGVKISPQIDLFIRVASEVADEHVLTIQVTGKGVQVVDEIHQHQGETRAWKIRPEESRGYSKFEIERQPQGWLVFLDSELIGEIEDSRQHVATINVEARGKTLFENPEVTGLTRKSNGN